jgi:hypothetical protein
MDNKGVYIYLTLVRLLKAYKLYFAPFETIYLIL